ncbi:MAG TPA: hypothetical protein VFD92_23810 [Candidatus Binatia bacterium]|nr:hypothetical protein [Candidatus Binatia bacterium]
MTGSAAWRPERKDPDRRDAPRGLHGNANRRRDALPRRAELRSLHAVGRAAIDTLGLARRLRDKAGFAPQAAEEAASAIADALADEVATRSDLAELKADLTRLVLTVATGQVALLIGAMLALVRHA